MSNEVTVIRDWSGMIIGKIETDSKGNKTVRDFYGRILGRYDAACNVTREFTGRVIAKGDASAMLLNMKNR